MYRSNRILAVVPARGGSKGIPLKNLSKVGDRSLLSLVGTVIKNVPFIDRAIVSTDHEAIAEEAQRNDIDVPFFRPDDLSGDRVGDMEVLQHALGKMETLDRTRYEIIVMLQPTSPSRLATDVEHAITTLVEGNYDAIWSVSETDSKAHPLKQLEIDEEGRLKYFDSRGAEIIARQQLSPVYHRNGIVYALTRNCIVNVGSLLPENAAACVIRRPVSNIDTEEDLVDALPILQELNIV